MCASVKPRRKILAATCLSDFGIRGCRIQGYMIVVPGYYMSSLWDFPSGILESVWKEARGSLEMRPRLVAQQPPITR